MPLIIILALDQYSSGLERDFEMGFSLEVLQSTFQERPNGESCS